MNQVIRTFAQALAGFVRTTAESMEFARECADKGLEHFAEHGDLCHVQAFYDAMPKNYTRRAAYLKWLKAFAPIAMVNKKFVKDTGEHASKLDLEGSKVKAFWDFAPEAEVTSFSADDVIAAVIATVDKFTNGKKYDPLDEKASREVKRIRGMIEVLKEHPLPAANDAPAAEHVEPADAPLQAVG